MPAPHAFRRAAETKDLDLLRDTLAEDVVLHSPILFKGFEGRDTAMFVLANVIEVFEDFRYLDEVQPLFPGGAHGIAHVHHAQLFSLVTNYAHLRHANSLVDTDRRLAPVIRTLTATSKACSYCCTS